MESMFSMRFVTLLFLLSTICCVEIGNKDVGGELKASRTRHLLFSMPLGITDSVIPYVQISFYEHYGNITPSKLDDAFVKSSSMRPHTLATFCTLTSYEEKMTFKRGEPMKKTRTKILCGLRDLTKVEPEAVSSSIFIAQRVYKIIRSVTEQISLFQWKTLSNIKIDDLNIFVLNLTSNLSQSLSGQFQMTAGLSFSTSPDQKFRVFNVAVLVRSPFGQFVNVSNDENLKEPRLQGLSIDVFRAATQLLPYHLAFKLVPYYGTCDQLVKEVARKTFDAAVGGILITAEQSQLVEFSQPYAELRMVMLVVNKKYNGLNGVFWFMSPFTRGMWLTLAAMTVFTGLVVLFIERRAGNELTNSAMFCFPFAFLFNEYRPRNRLSYFLLAPWLLLTLLVVAVFTASLGSMVTSSLVEPSGFDVNELKRKNSAIGCDGNPFVVSYLVKKLGFKRKNIKNINSIDKYEKAMSSGNIKAAFLLMPEARVFLSKYCSGFTKSGHSYDLGSFGFVFPRYSSLVAYISEAVLKLKEAGELLQMEEDIVSFSDCSKGTSSDQTVGNPGIGPEAFTVLFIVSGGASASALLIVVIRVLRRRFRWENCIQRIQRLTTLLSHN